MPCCIDFRSQCGKQTGECLYFIEYHEMVAVAGKKEVGMRQLRTITFALKIEEKRTRNVFGYFSCERGLANLARAEQCHRRLLL
jgi:hypothetical protein